MLCLCYYETFFKICNKIQGVSGLKHVEDPWFNKIVGEQII